MGMSSRTLASRGGLLSVVLAATFAALGIICNAPSACASQFAVINFFLHDNLLTLTNPSAYTVVLPVPSVALANLLSPNKSFFGSVIVFDDSMTTLPSPTSLEIGRGRGIYVFDANDQLGAGIEFSWTAQFNAASGYGAGSTLTFKGFDRTTDAVREIAIVGGTGTFRLARGWADITTYSLVGAAAVLNFTANVYYGV